MTPLRPSAIPTEICPLYGPLLPLGHSVPSMALYPFYGPLFTQQTFVSSTAFFIFYNPLSFYGPLSPLQPRATVSLDDTLYPLWSYVPSKAICPLYGPMSPLRPSATSTALYPI